MIPNLNHVYVLLEKLNDYARYSGLAEMVGLRGRFIVEEFVRYYQNPSSPKAGDMQKSIEELRSGRGRLNMPDWLFDELDQLRRNGNQASHGDKGITYTLPEAYTCAFSVVAWAVQRCFSKCLEIAKEIGRGKAFYGLVVTSRAFSPGDMAGGASKVTVMNGSGEMNPGLSSSASGPDSKPRAKVTLSKDAAEQQDELDLLHELFPAEEVRALSPNPCTHPPPPTPALTPSPSPLHYPQPPAPPPSRWK